MKTKKINKNILSTILLVFILFFSSCERKNLCIKEVAIIPQVQKTVIKKAYFTLHKSSVFVTENSEQYRIAAYLSDKINKAANWKTTVVVGGNTKADIQFVTDQNLAKEAYQICIDKTHIKIKASSNAGFFYGMQSLRQLLPEEIERANAYTKDEIILSELEITDAPAFQWRGMMLDVSRHFFSVAEVKDLIDLMSFLKLNTFHWHLVDDQGWRIEIKKYPKLTEVGAWRVNQEEKHWNKRDTPGRDEKATFGGFYTQKQIKEVVAYAQSKYITVVPEIEIPAHVMSAIAAYPFLSCKGEQIQVPSGGVWPITEIYCAGKESTYTFIQDVLDEVVALFPSQYIHIGGDEATKTNWKHCKHCQLKMKNENLHDVEALQSYMIKHFANYLQSKNKIMIGWDEIMEGGLADGAVVMSWRGEKGGIEAAEQEHPVVMSPNTYVYFDYYQAAKFSEPLAIGGYLPLSKVYEFSPIPKELDKKHQHYVLGGQANVWTEYMPNYKHVQYMVFPRLLALAESVWIKDEQKNWANFSKRVELMMQRFDFMNVNYAKSAYKLRSELQFNPNQKKLELRLFNEFEGTEIRYTTDGNLPNKDSKYYTTPLSITSNTIVKAQAFVQNEPVGAVFADSIQLHTNKVFGKKVTYTNRYTEKYNSGGLYGLVDQRWGSSAFDDRKWQGWFDEPVEFVVDLKEQMSVTQISLRFLVDRKNQILLPRKVEIFTSPNNMDYSLLASFENDATLNNEIVIKTLAKKCDGGQTNYIKVKVANASNENTNEKGWTFIDEIIVL